MNVFASAGAVVTALFVTVPSGPAESIVAKAGGHIAVTARWVQSHSPGGAEACLVDDGLLATYCLAPLLDPESGTSTSSMSNGFISTSTGECSIENDDGFCSARNVSSRKCSVKKSGKCSIIESPEGVSTECSVMASSGYNCSVVDVGTGTPSGKCSVFDDTDSADGNQCSTLSGSASSPQCSVIQHGEQRNSGSCSIFIVDDNSTCSSYYANSRCSVSEGVSGQCTAYQGASGLKCSTQGEGHPTKQCSTLLDNGGVTGPDGGKCEGKPEQATYETQ